MACKYIKSKLCLQIYIRSTPCLQIFKVRSRLDLIYLQAKIRLYVFADKE